MAAARELFALRGYENVSMTDVAAALGMSASSLYRHIASKQEMLAATVDAALVAVEGATVAALTFEGLCADLADVVMAQSDLWILLRRESLHLDGTDRDVFVDRYQRMIDAARSALSDERPELSSAEADLRARCALACMAAPREQATARSMTAAGIAATALAVGRGGGRPEVTLTRDDLKSATGAWASSRTDELLAAAEGLISRRGYAAVTLEQLGEAAGMSGPSLYHHFANKSSILVALVERAAREMEARRVEALSVPGGPAATLSTLARSYLTFAIAHADLFRVLVNDSVSIPAGAAADLAALRSRQIETWVVMAEALDQRGRAVERAACALSIIDELAAAQTSSWLVASAGGLFSSIQDALGL
ncbi:TetR/AcrR family transcriptional regulator [Nocardioides marmoriginsengisoli]|nr:helix-turn-helix domain-containing protein [Nocardioides marmoriginsengisoli]